MTQLNTKLVHGLPLGTDTTGAVNPPIYNSSTYAFETVESMPRWDYARSGNPTREFLERQIAQLEHGTRGFAFASGLAAIHAVLSIFAPPELPPQAARETAMTAPRRIPNSFFLITMNPPFFLKCPAGTPDPPEKPCRRFFRRVVYKESQE